jgi:hypothetical protein
MKIIKDYGLKIETARQYNHVLEHSLYISSDSGVYNIEVDIFTECNNDGEVVDFDVRLIDEDRAYSDEETEEIEEYLTKTLRP